MDGRGGRHDRAVFRSIAAVIAATQMAWGVLTPVLPAFADSLGLDPAGIGILVAAFGLGRIVANIPAGYLGVRVNRHHLLIGGALGVVAFTTAGGMVSTFEGLLVLRLLTGVAGGIAMTSGQTLVVDAVGPGSTTRAMATLQGLQLAGGAIGPALGGLAAARLGIRAPFFVAGVVCLVFVAWILTSRSIRIALIEAGRPSRRAERVGTGPGRPARRGLAATYVVGFAVFYSRFGIQQTLLPLVALQAAGLSVGELGVLFSAMAAVNIACLLLVGTLTDRIGTRPMIVWPLAAVAVVTSLFALPDSPLPFIILCLMFGVVTGVGGPVPAAYLAEITAGFERGPAVGIYRTFGDLAGIVGPVVIGILVATVGVDGAALTSAAIPLAGAVGFAALTRGDQGDPRRGAHQRP